MNRAAIRAVIESNNPDIVGDLLRYANDLRTTGRIKDAADIKLKLLSMSMDDTEADDALVVFTVKRGDGKS